MKFLKYPSLTNHYVVPKSNFLTNLLDKTFYSTEKIHGANISIIVDKNEVCYAKRSSFLIDSEMRAGMFSNLPEIAKSTKIEEVLKQIREEFGAMQVYGYGEIYGAGVQRMEYKENLSKVKSIRLFDVFVEDKDSKITVLGLADLQKYFTPDQLVPFESKGKTLKEYISEDLDLSSQLGGIREGNVYKLVDTYELTYDPFSEKYLFVGVKHKTDDFKEVGRIQKIKEIEHIDTTTLKFIETLSTYLTENRLKNVLSHGEIEPIPQNIGKLIKIFTADVYKEFFDENPEYTPSDFSKIVTKKTSNLSAKLIKDYLMKI